MRASAPRCRHWPQLTGATLGLVLAACGNAQLPSSAAAVQPTEQTMTANNAPPRIRIEDHFQGPELALARAAAIGDASAVRRLVAGGADPNAISPKGMPLLLWPIREGSEAGVGALIEAGAQPDIRDGHGSTALIWAVRSDQPAIARRLLAHGADPDARDTSGRPALVAAYLAGSWDSVVALVDAGAALDAGTPPGSYNTLLATAAGFGDFERAMWLIERGADPTLRLTQAPYPDRIGAQPILEHIFHRPTCPGSPAQASQREAQALLRTRGVTPPPAPRDFAQLQAWCPEDPQAEPLPPTEKVRVQSR